MMLDRLIRRIAEKVVNVALSKLNTHSIAQVIEYDPDENMCKVQNVTQSIRSDDPDNEEGVNRPVLGDVPVQQFGSGKVWLTVAPQVDAYGSMHTCDRSVERWKEEGGIITPNSTRKFCADDGIFSPGVVPLADDADNGKFPTAIEIDRISMRTRTGDTQVSVVSDESVVVKNANATITVDASGNVTIDPSASVTVTSSGNVQVNAPKQILNSEADAVALSTKVDLLWTTLDTLFRTTWVPAPTDGGAALKAAYINAFATPPATVASAKMKLDS